MIWWTLSPSTISRKSFNLHLSFHEDDFLEFDDDTSVSTFVRLKLGGLTSPREGRNPNRPYIERYRPIGSSEATSKASPFGACRQLTAERSPAREGWGSYRVFCQPLTPWSLISICRARGICPTSLLVSQYPIDPCSLWSCFRRTMKTSLQSAPI